MSERVLEQTQQIAAKTAGAIFLFVLALAAFNEFFIRPGFFVSGDADATARNIIASTGLFRINIAVDLFIAMVDLTLGVAIYVLLKPVSRILALLALSYRVVECAILGVITIFYFAVLLVLGGDEFLAAFEADQLNALSRLFIKIYSVGYFVGVIFFSLGSIVYSYLLLNSNYISKLLAGWGIFASLLLFAALSALFIVPNDAMILFPACLMPIALYELVLGFWLLIKGVKLNSQGNGHKDAISASVRA